MGKYQPGDYVKAIFKADRTDDTERMWIKVDTCDDERRVVFGTLDNEPIAAFLDKLWLGKELALSYDLIVAHRKAVELGQRNSS